MKEKDKYDFGKFVEKNTTYNPHIMFISKKKVYKLLSTRFISKKSNWIGYYGVKNKAFKREDFENSNKVYFGKNQYYQLDNVEEYLARFYGPTYNQIPPPNKQINHKPVRLEL